MTDKKKASRDTQRRLRALADTSPAFVSYIRRDYCFQYANRAYRASFGVERLAGKHLGEVMGAETFAQRKPLLDRAFAGEAVEFDALLAPDGQGRRRRVRARYVPDVGDQGRVRGAVEFPVSIALALQPSSEGARIVAENRGEAEQGLPAGAFALHPALAESMGEGVCLVRAGDETLAFTNAAFDRMLGYERGELLGKSIASLQLADPGRAGAAGTEGPWEVEARRKDGSPLSLRVRTTKVDVPGVGPAWLRLHEDISEAKRQHARLMARDRLASLGTLAAGILHEINNPLAYVISNLDMIADELRGLSSVAASPGQLHDFLGMVRDAREGAERVRSIARGIKSFSRPDDDRRGPVDVRAVLTTAIALAEGATRHRARIVKDFAEVTMVEADEGRLGHLFVNLLLHAARSIPPGRLAENEVRVVVRQETAKLVQIAVADTGTGMGAEALARIFDVSSVDPVGEISGFGLAVCGDIVTALGGRIEAQSTEGKGTVVRVVLPSAAVEEADRPAPSSRGGGKSRPPSGARRGRILVIDDDTMVAGTIRRIFERDHDVTTATGAAQVLEWLRDGRRYDAIVCDLMMPAMTGMDLFAEIGRTIPELRDRIVFITGGAFTPAARAFLDRVSNRRVEKPFAPQVLRATVEEVIGAGPGAKTG